MVKGLIGRKIGMHICYSSEGEFIPITVLNVGPCTVTQVKTQEKDGYNAIQLGFKEQKNTRVNKALRGHFEKSGRGHFEILKEFPIENIDKYEVGQVISLASSFFEPGQKVSVVGFTKGRGFSGVIRRHGFHGGKKTHGSHSQRIPGSVGCSAWPSKIIKGKKMPGQYGKAKKTIQNLTIVEIRREENLILIKGSVPGYNSGVVFINKVK